LVNALSLKGKYKKKINYLIKFKIERSINEKPSAEAGAEEILVGVLLSSISGGIPGEDEADRVVEPPLDDLEESPLGPQGVRFSSIRRGDGGDIAGVVDTEVAALLVDGVLVADVIKANVVVRFF